jgi:hypothetical protein
MNVAVNTEELAIIANDCLCYIEHLSLIKMAN